MSTPFPRHGILNHIDKPLTGPRLDIHKNSAASIVNTMANSIYVPNALLGTGPYKAIVLRVETQPLASEAGGWVSQFFGNMFGKGKEPKLVEVKARIPEIHSMLLVPKLLGNDSKEQNIIEMYPTFIAISDDLPAPDVGSLIWVDFGNKTNYTDPIYVKPVNSKSPTPSSAGGASGKDAFGNACAGSFLSNAPIGDVMNGVNRSLSHSGLPLNLRKTNHSISQEFSFIKGLRYSPEKLDKWEKAIQQKGIPGKTWFGSIASNGLEDSNHPKGKRDTLIFVPNQTDFSLPVELMYYFHGVGEFGTNYDFTTRYPKIIKELCEVNRNFILVIPELPWCLDTKIKKLDTAWIGKDNFASFHREVVIILNENFSNVVKATFISITGFAGGGSAIKTAASSFSSMAPNKITFVDASYLDYAHITWDTYVVKNQGVEFNLLVQSNGSPKTRAKDLYSKIETNSNVYYEEIVGKNQQQIGDIGLTFINPKRAKEIEENAKKAIEEVEKNPVKDVDREEPIPPSAIATLVKDFSDGILKSGDSKAPLSSNANISPSARTKEVKGKEGVLVKEAKVFEEARVATKDYGSLTGNEAILVPAPSAGGNKILVHKLLAKRLAVMNADWMKENPGYEDIKIASGFRKFNWPSQAEYEAHIIKEYGSVEEGRKWLAFNSPHETGLAIDIGNNGLTPNRKTNEQQKKTKLYNWLRSSAHKYGFTPYKLEAWHWELRLPKESWATGDEFTDNLAVRVEKIGESNKMPIGSSGDNKPCVSQLGNNMSSVNNKGDSNFVPSSSSELQLRWNSFAKGVPPNVNHLLSLGQMVDNKWRDTIKKYLGNLPYGIMCIRIGHESRGNPNAQPTKCCGETGLLQIWCGKDWHKGQGPMSPGDLGDVCKRKFKEFDPFNPSHSCWGGLSDANVRIYKLKSSSIGYLFPNSDLQLFGALMVQMNAGEGALKGLLKISGARPGTAFTDLVEFVAQIGSRLEQYQKYFGSQSVASVARRVLVVPYWLKASEQLGQLTTDGFGFARIPDYY